MQIDAVVLVECCIEVSTLHFWMKKYAQMNQEIWPTISPYPTDMTSRHLIINF